MPQRNVSISYGAGWWEVQEGTYQAGRGGAIEVNQVELLLLLAFLFATAAFDDADENENANKARCDHNGNESPFGY